MSCRSGGIWIPPASDSSLQGPLVGHSNHGLGREGWEPAEPPSLSLRNRFWSGEPKWQEVKRGPFAWVSSRNQGVGSAWAGAPIKVALGTPAVPRWSQNSAPGTTGQWCLTLDFPPLHRPAEKVQSGWLGLRLHRPPGSRQKQWKESSNPMGARGWRRCYTPLLPHPKRERGQAEQQHLRVCSAAHPHLPCRPTHYAQRHGN